MANKNGKQTFEKMNGRSIQLQRMTEPLPKQTNLQPSCNI